MVCTMPLDSINHVLVAPMPLDSSNHVLVDNSDWSAISPDTLRGKIFCAHHLHPISFRLRIGLVCGAGLRPPPSRQRRGPVI